MSENEFLIHPIYLVFKDTLVFLADKTNTELVILTGGTGFTNRDLTPEATSQVVDKLTPGITIALISGSLQKTPFAMLSRLEYF